MEEKKYKKFNIIEGLWGIIYTFILFYFTYLVLDDYFIENLSFFGYLLTNRLRIYLFVGFIIMLSIFFIIKSLIKDNLKTNVVLTIIVLIITFISYYKFKALELPFMPTDILLVGNAGEIASFGLTFPSISAIVILVLIITILVLQKIIRKKYYQKEKISLKTDWYRIPLFIIGIIALYNICIAPNRFEKLGLENNLGNNYYWMGGNGVFFMHLGDLYYPVPNNYNQETISKMEEETQIQDIANKDNPNVIYIMNESFADPNKIENVSYSVNPLQNIDKLKEEKNCIYGRTITPVLGGGTSLPEFEALTGLSSYYIEKQIFPYTSYITEDMNSIVRVYNNNEYTTIGIHPNTETFYNRKDVYKYLGFEETIFLEDMENPEMKAEKVSDNEFADQIIKAYEDIEGKKFIFGVTMQNHMPYKGNLYENYDIEVETSELQDNTKQELKNYVQGIYDSDQMYMKLVNYFKNTDEPTILVMFGDHLPSISGFGLYKNSNFSSLDYYITPYIIWANYDIEEKDISSYMSPSYLSINLLKMSNIQLPWYLQKFEELYINYPAINNNFVINKDGSVLKIEKIKNEDLVNDCRILQYDLLIKKKYIQIQ